MGETSTDNMATTIDDLEVIVDSDFHLSEKQSDFLPYIESPFKERLFDQDQYGEEDKERHSSEFKSFYPSPGVFAPYNTGLTKSRSVRTKDDIQEAKELLSVDIPICTPSLNLYLSVVQHDDLAVALGSAYNKWLLDNIIDPDLNIYGAVVVAPQKPEESATEIKKHAGEKGVAAALVPSGGVHPALGDDRYHPIWEAAEQANLPVMFHSASGAIMDAFPLQKQSYNRYLPQHATGHAMQSMVHISTMITAGVPELYPDLDFVFQEAGVGWVPYLMRRLDHEYRTEPEDAPLLKQMPSDYIRDQFKFTTQPIEGIQDPTYLKYIIEIMDGSKTLMFSSDYPHYDFDYTDQLFKVVRGSFDRDVLGNIYGGTALETYNLK